ncbi:uncharacterized mitochondrial protein-like protein [Tanacetum coccineum]|uniref:Uncharacterized mitochondrial protein-like protein n=1 Tax=Tanacetum coccineum TaxID=301880 RepID=A0ABQ5DE91_9ASTR
METVPSKDYIVLPVWPADPLFPQSSKHSSNAGFKPSWEEEKKNAEEPGNEANEVPSTEEPRVNQENDDYINNTNNVNTVSLTVNAASIEVNADDNEDVGAEADINNLSTFIHVSPILTTRVHKDHPVEQIIRDLHSAPQTRRMTKNLKEQEGIDNDEVFAPVARIEAIRLFLAYALFKDFVVYQMDVKSAFLYGKIKEEVYICQPPGFEDPDFLDRVYKVEKALYGLHQAPRACDVKTASTPMETHKPLLKYPDGEDVDEHLYRLMIGSLMYLTSSMPDIMFAVCACARYQINLKMSHLYAVKRIFRYLKGQPKFGLWYLKDSPFDLVAYTNSDYAEASLDKKSTTGGCQFLGCSMISWQCKKQTVVVNSTTKAEYIAASNCCR